MNKKFSTLVASLLLTSAFSVYSVDAKPMLATPTQVETRAAAADVEDAVEVTGTLPALTWQVNNYVLSGFTNNARISYVGILNGTAQTNTQFVCIESTSGNRLVTLNQSYGVAYADDYYWTLINGRLVANSGVEFSLSGLDEFVEIVPIAQNGEITKYFAIAKRDNNGNLNYAEWDGSNAKLIWSSSASRDYSTNIANAALFVSMETAFTNTISAADANAILKDGFNVSISSAKKEDAVITNAEAFGGKLTAQNETYGNTFNLQNEAGKFIVFDENADITSDGYSENGKFILVDAAQLASYGDYGKFNIHIADNGSGFVQITTGQYSNYRLYIANVNDTYGLSVAEKVGQSVPAEYWAITSLTDNNIVNPKEWLTGQFYTVDYKGNVTAANVEEYKKDGRLVVRNTGASNTLQADFIEANGLYEKAPEAQWAVSASYDGTEINGFTLTNRENPAVKVTITELRRVDNQSYYRVAAVSSTTPSGIDEGDFITMNAVTTHDKHDGYEVVSANDLRNETYHLGQVRQTADGDINVYWAENHTSSHQIGATVNEANATRWNLGLAYKSIADHTTEIDSVLVVSELQDWNDAKSRIDVKKDTLVILPYVFQNRSNNEYVVMNDQTNLEYYICDKDNKETPAQAQRFALKMKADSTYNYVVLPSYPMSQLYVDGNVVPSNNGIATSKVFQENSTDRGTWRDMAMYANDANSLMFVAKVDAPEYRKLVTTANLDTIKLYRADNEAQVVYEKKDAKSVVEGDTLSFLNIDNETQFTTINPALYADTAYVNRGDNTCWQYLLGVNIEHKEGYYCPEHGFGETEPCTHAVWVSYNKGRYLMNMIDTANVYGKTAGIHNNPYINETEEGLTCAKLSFVDAIHVLTDNVDPTKADKLYVINGAESRDKYTVIDLSSADFNVAKFAFKYTDSMESDEFKIQTQWKEYDPTTYGTGAYNNNGANFSQEGYLRWVNGCIVVDKGYQKGDVFNMNEDETRTPTANEEISAEEATVSVVATDGAVIVKGAEGKNVIVSTILGKVVANEVVNSDNETIAAPAGIVVVSVDGESFKVAVK